MTGRFNVPVDLDAAHFFASLKTLKNGDQHGATKSLP